MYQEEIIYDIEKIVCFEEEIRDSKNIHEYMSSVKYWRTENIRSALCQEEDMGAKTCQTDLPFSQEGAKNMIKTDMRVSIRLELPQIQTRAYKEVHTDGIQPDAR